jgi:hypothetical protein
MPVIEFSPGALSERKGRLRFHKRNIQNISKSKWLQTGEKIGVYL